MLSADILMDSILYSLCSVHLVISCFPRALLHWPSSREKKKIRINMHSLKEKDTTIFKLKPLNLSEKKSHTVKQMKALAATSQPCAIRFHQSITTQQWHDRDVTSTSPFPHQLVKAPRYTHP